jgi:hypothetical protein
LALASRALLAVLWTQPTAQDEIRVSPSAAIRSGLALVVSQAAKRQPHWREVSSQHDGANFLPGLVERRLRR